MRPWLWKSLSVVVLVGLLAGLTGGATAFAAARAEPGDPPGPGGGGRPGARLIAARALLRELSEQTGLDRCEVLAALAEGQTPAEIATENGVDPQDIVDALLARLQERLDIAVERGRLTQERADALMAAAADRLDTIMTTANPEAAQRAYERICVVETEE